MNYRHGDLELVGIAELPQGLKQSDSKVLMTGSSNNPHSFDNGEFYPCVSGNFIIGYLVAKSTMLFHPDHGKKVKNKKLREAKIADGIYELRQQVEDTHSGMKRVQD
jgi:hypothetical protein